MAVSPDSPNSNERIAEEVRPAFIGDIHADGARAPKVRCVDLLWSIETCIRFFRSAMGDRLGGRPLQVLGRRVSAQKAALLACSLLQPACQPKDLKGVRRDYGVGDRLGSFCFFVILALLPSL